MTLSDRLSKSWHVHSKVWYTLYHRVSLLIPQHIGDRLLQTHLRLHHGIVHNILIIKCNWWNDEILVRQQMSWREMQIQQSARANYHHQSDTHCIDCQYMSRYQESLTAAMFPDIFTMLWRCHQRTVHSRRNNQWEDNLDTLRPSVNQP